MHTHSTDGLIRDVAISGGPSKATDIANLLANAIVTTIVSGVIVGLILLTAVVTVIVAGMSSLPSAMGCKCILVGRLDLLTTQLIDGRTVFTSPLVRDIDGHEVLAYRPDQSGVRHFSGALKATIEAPAHGR